MESDDHCKMGKQTSCKLIYEILLDFLNKNKFNKAIEFLSKCDKDVLVKLIKYEINLINLNPKKTDLIFKNFYYFDYIVENDTKWEKLGGKDKHETWKLLFKLVILLDSKEFKNMVDNSGDFVYKYYDYQLNNF